MEKITLNTTGKARTEFIGDTEYRVADLTMIVPGVLNGSKGPLLYPEDEVTNNPQAWNGMPILVYHPLDGKTSGRDPEVLNNQGIGYIYNSSVEGKNLKAQGWFNVEDTKRVDNRVFDALEEGTQIEISTGLDLTMEPASDGAVFNGVKYDYVAKDYKPDHLAILPDKKGACSLKDGCGVFNQEDCKCGGECGPCKANSIINDERGEKVLFFFTENELSHGEIHSQLSSLLNEQRNGDSYCWVTEVYNHEFIYEKNSEYYKQGYTVSEGVVSLVDSPQQVVKEITYKPIANQENPMATKTAKTKLVDQVIANCDCWEDEDRHTLNRMSEKQLKTLFVSNEDGEEDTTPPVVEETKVEETPTPEPTPTPAPAPTEQSTANQKLSLEEWMKLAPSEVQSVVKNALDIENQERIRIVGVMTENASEDKRASLKEILMSKTLNELRTLSALIPKDSKSQETVSNFFGQMGGSPEPSVVKVEPMSMPVMNWRDEVQ